MPCGTSPAPTTGGADGDTEEEILLCVYTSVVALSIKSEEADRLARELAAETGESLTEAVVSALRERLARTQVARGPRMSERLRRLQAVAATLPVLDPRSPDQIIGYDATGLPV